MKSPLNDRNFRKLRKLLRESINRRTFRNPERVEWLRRAREKLHEYCYVYTEAFVDVVFGHNGRPLRS